MLENMVEGVTVTDENAAILYTNPAFDAMFGYDTGELIGQHVSVLNNNPPEENQRIVSEIVKQLKENGAWFGEFSNCKKDGTSFFTYARISALRVSGKTYWVSVQEDITERKRLEKELARAQRLETAGRLAGQIAHDFNNLLGPLVAYPDLIHEQLPAGHPVLKLTDEIEFAASKIADINQQMLASGRRGHYRVEPVNLNNLVHKAMQSQNLP